MAERETVKASGATVFARGMMMEIKKAAREGRLFGAEVIGSRQLWGWNLNGIETRERTGFPLMVPGLKRHLAAAVRQTRPRFGLEA